MTFFFTLIAALIHFYIFFLESILWGRPKTNRAFGVTPEIAEHNRLFAFNQAFYNLFLSIAALMGLVLGPKDAAGATLIVYSLSSMFFASLVLYYSNRKLVRAALIQGVPPLLGLFFLII